ncbi:hypothetical protein B0H16DRAFT_1461493 [Mycena metata]|uniref:Uncharacterized protein n=1 Tax=Mycena metata TaxID=1033252 RepID=A0AAD7IR74_9AGAR|nr:hypothetical protein B0H16DRAFT_1461493 [Mycena metata]
MRQHPYRSHRAHIRLALRSLTSSSTLQQLSALPVPTELLGVPRIEEKEEERDEVAHLITWTLLSGSDLDVEVLWSIGDERGLARAKEGSAKQNKRCEKREKMRVRELGKMDILLVAFCHQHVVQAIVGGEAKEKSAKLSQVIIRVDFSREIQEDKRRMT